MRTSRTTDPTPKAIVGTSETSRLLAHLGLRQTVEQAIASGRIKRTKVAEAWLYHPSAIDHDALIVTALGTAEEILDDWLLVPLPVMAGMMSAQLDPSCSHQAARALLHELLHSDQLGALGMMTAKAEPYLAVHRHDDADELKRQLAFVRDALRCRSTVGYDNLPATHRPLSRRAWKKALLGHAEFRCWGRLRGNVIEPWVGA